MYNMEQLLMALKLAVNLKSDRHVKRVLNDAGGVIGLSSKWLLGSDVAVPSEELLSTRRS
mgnify:CR=1 FL=1